MIITALSAVGSSQAQDALCAAIRARKDDSHELNGLVPVLGTLRDPTEQVVALLNDLSHSSSSDVRSMALLAMGGAAKNLAQKSTERANAIVNTLATELSMSPAVGESSTLLLALGNSGTKRAEDILLSKKTDQSPEQRRTVVAALADFQSPRSVHALCGSLNVDEDIRVRAAAAQALARHVQVSAAKDTLLRAAEQDSAESVRLASMFALTDLIQRDEHVREVIGALAHDDSSATVRKQAAALLVQKVKPPQL
jgi:HEAT repeat protein